MPKNNKAKSVDPWDEWFLAFLAFLFVAAIVKAAFWAWDLLMRILNFVDNAMTLLGKGLILLGLAVIAAFLIAAIMDALAPLAIRWKKHRNIRTAISRCALPKIQTFRGQPSDSDVDRWLAEVVLSHRYLELFGEYPNFDSFRGREAEFALFRAKELTGMLLVNFRIVTEQYVFTPIYEAYRSGENEKLVKWINDAIVASRKRHPLRFTGRVLRVVTFRFGFRTGEKFVRNTVEDHCTDRQFIFNEILWLHFWPNASLLTSWVELDFGLGDEQFTSNEPEQSEAADDAEPERPVLMLPPPSGEPVIVPEPEQDEELAEEEIDRQALEEEAVHAVDTVLGFFENYQDQAWDSPDLLDKIESVLCQAEEHHPEPLYVRSKIHWLQQLKEKRPTFDAAFEKAISAESEKSPDWFRNAIPKIGSELMDEAAFKRYCLIHFLLSESEVDEKSHPRLSKTEKTQQKLSSQLDSKEERPCNILRPKSGPKLGYGR